MRILESAHGAIVACSWTAKGRYLITINAAGEVELWDGVQLGVHYACWPGELAEGRLAVHPQEEGVVAGIGWDAQLCLTIVESAERPRLEPGWQGVFPAFPSFGERFGQATGPPLIGAPRQLAGFTPNGAWWIHPTGRQERLVRWPLREPGPAVVHRFRGDRPEMLALHPTQELAALSFSLLGTVELHPWVWPLHQPTQPIDIAGHLALVYPQTADRFIPLDHQVRMIQDLAFSPDGHWLAVLAGSSLWLWTLADFPNPPQCVAEAVVGLERGPAHLAFAPAQANLLTGHSDEITLWEVPSLQPQASYRFDVGKILQLQVAPDGSRAAALGHDGRIVFWDLID